MTDADNGQVTTASGLPLEEFYGPGDRASEDYGAGIGDPGNYPFTRGFHPTSYRQTPWMMQQVLGAGLPEHTREIMDRMVDEGMEAYFGHPVFNVVLDNPSKGGIDPDWPEAKAHVGVGGMNLSKHEDLRRLVDGLPLDKINLSIITGDTCIIALGMYVVAAEELGYEPAQLRGNSMNWLLKSFCVDNPDFPPQAAQKLTCDLIQYAAENMPKWNTTNFSGYLIREAGSNAVQELAFTLAWGMSVLDECVERGLEIDTVAARVGFQMAFHNDFFEEVAKLRAHRRMWAKILKDRYGATNPKAMMARVHIHTAGDTLLAQQPENNIVRVAFQVLGSVMSQVASIHSCAYTEALEIPTAEQARLALRTQQIALHETNVPKVADPLGGSYFVEQLTDDMEAAVQGLLNEIDQMGGFIEAIESGWIKSRIVDQLLETQEQIDDGELAKIGLNKYQVDEAPESRPDVYRIDPEVEQEAVRRMETWRENRDQEAVKRALEEVRIAAENDDYLMPSILDAVRAHASQGEVMNALKDAYGWGFVTD